MIPYLSFTSYNMFKTKPEEFYRIYCNKSGKPDRSPQNHYMAVGSAFDAYAKAQLYKDLVAKGDPKMDLEYLFNTQVEEQCRVVARVDGLKVWNAYNKTGGYRQLLTDITGCIGDPRFEQKVETTIDGVTLLGKPDVMFIHRGGARVIGDFKVQGFYSKTPPSAKNGFIKRLPSGLAHKNACVMNHKGIAINVTCPLHATNEEWAQQLCMYAWVMGEPVGSDFVLMIDHLLCNMPKDTIETVRYAGICTPDWQFKFFEELRKAWINIQQNYIFTNMTYEENLAKQAGLDIVNATVLPEGVREML
jgi:hypothetical protein